MAFPATGPVLDPLVGSGALSGSWLSPALSSAGTIVLAAGGATPAAPSTIAGAVWTTATATGLAAFVTVATAPATSSSKIVAVGFQSDPHATPGGFQAQYLEGVGISLVTPSGNAGVVVSTVNNGDAIGVSLNAAATLATAWYRAAGTTAWIPAGTKAQAFPQAGSQGWFLMMWMNDVNSRLRDFGGEILPGVDVTAPIEHGRGAC